MSTFDSFLNDSQDEPCIEGDEPSNNMQPVHATSNHPTSCAMNLELTMDVPIPESMSQKAEADDNDDGQKGLLHRLVGIAEKVEARLGVVEAQLECLDKRSSTAEGILLQVLQVCQQKHDNHDKIVMIPRPCGSRLEQSKPHKQASDSKFAPPAPVADARGARKNASGDDGKFFTHLRTASEKGKGTVGAPQTEGSLFDIIVPNSPGYDDDVLIDESRSTPRISIDATLVVPPQTTLPKWPSAPPRQFGVNPSRATKTVGATDDMDLRSLPVWTQFESTTRVAGMYASSPEASGPRKVPKLERIEVTATDATPPSTLKRMLASAFPPVPQTSPLSREATNTVAAVRRNRNENNSNCVPMAYEMAFRPTPDMGLTMEQTKLAAYVFGKRLPLAEILFRYRGFSIPRGVFMSLVPPWTPHTDLINTASMIGSMVASKLMAPRIWYFPSNFADEVLKSAPMDRLQAAYTLPWMPETNNLHYVFVPIWEPADVWYLMMLDVKESRVYAFDVNKTPESIIRREANMTRICRTLGKLFMLNRNLVNFRHGTPNPANWGKFHYPAGLPTDVDGVDTAVWCLYWLLQEGGFSPRIFNPLSDADTVRMKAAIKIIQSVGNEEGGSIDVRSQLNWLDVISLN